MTNIQQAITERTLELLALGDPHKLFPEGYKRWNEDADSEPKAGPFQSTGNAMLDRIATNFGGRIEFGGTGAYNRIEKSAVNAQGFCEPDNDKHWMVLPNVADYVSLDAYRETIAHELIHWVETRLRKYVAGIDDLMMMFIRMGMAQPPKPYCIEEASAEIGAALVMDACGIDPDVETRSRYAAQYLAFYPESDWREMLATACKHATEDADYLLKFA